MNPAKQQSITISKEQFESLARFLHKCSGIYLKDIPKNYNLIYNRTMSLCRSHGITTTDQLVSLIKSDRFIQSKFVESMTTHTTAFFRESEHFRFLADHFQKHGQDSNQPILIWSAACSSGEEPYSIGITALESPVIRNRDFKILATDINPKILQRAREGIYTQKVRDEIPANLLERYFTLFSDGPNKSYRVNSNLAQKIQFASLNLVLDYPFTRKLDIIFCRNVLIYFDQEDIEKIIDKMTVALRPGGLLVLGHCEAAMGHRPKLLKLAPSIFQKKDGK